MACSTRPPTPRPRLSARQHQVACRIPRDHPRMARHRAVMTELLVAPRGRNEIRARRGRWCRQDPLRLTYRCPTMRPCAIAPEDRLEPARKVARASAQPAVAARGLVVLMRDAGLPIAQDVAWHLARSPRGSGASTSCPSARRTRGSDTRRTTVRSALDDPVRRRGTPCCCS